MLLTAHDFTEKALIQTIANRLQNCSSMQPNPNDWLKNKLDEYLQNAHDTALNHGHSRIDLHILSIIPSLYMPDDESDKMDIFSNIIRYYHLQLHPLGWQLHMSEKHDFTVFCFVNYSNLKRLGACSYPVVQTLFSSYLYSTKTWWYYIAGRLTTPFVQEFIPEQLY